MEPRPVLERFDLSTSKAREVLSQAREQARRFNHDYIGTEHLLLGLLAIGPESNPAFDALNSIGLDLDRASQVVEVMIGRGDQPAPFNIGLTAGAKRVIEYSVEEARMHGDNCIGPEHLLLGLSRKGQGIATGVLLSRGKELEDVRAQVETAIARARTP